MTAKAKGYYSYLLRLWQADEGHACTWCASLEQPGTGERLGFATLEQLFTFLSEQTGATDRGVEEDSRQATQGKERQG